jgi:hypothetical protein
MYEGAILPKKSFLRLTFGYLTLAALGADIADDDDDEVTRQIRYIFRYHFTMFQVSSLSDEDWRRG